MSSWGESLISFFKPSDFRRTFKPFNLGEILKVMIKGPFNPDGGAILLRLERKYHPGFLKKIIKRIDKLQQFFFFK